MRIKKFKIFKYCRHLLEFLLLRLFLFFANLFPRKAWLKLGEKAGILLLKVGFYRSIVVKNLQFVGLWSESEQEVLIHKIYATMGRYAADFLLPMKSLPELQIQGLELLKPASQPFIFFLGHFGNWELLPAIFPRDKKKLVIIAKPMNNPLVEKWLSKKRQRWNCRILHPRHAVRKALESLERGESVALLSDQYSGKMGRVATFMKKETHCIRTAAGLTQKSGCPALSAVALMQKDGSYQVLIEAPKAPANKAEKMNDQDSQIMACLKTHNDLLSKWILRYPEHWFGWFHRRFRESVNY